MNTTIRNYSNFLNDKKLKHEIINENVIALAFKAQNDLSVKIFISATDDTLNLKAYGLGNAKNKRTMIMEIFNNLNYKLRWFKVYLDKDEDIIIESDFFIDDFNNNEQIQKYVNFAVLYAEKAYPILMKAIWSL